MHFAQHYYILFDVVHDARIDEDAGVIAKLPFCSDSCLLHYLGLAGAKKLVVLQNSPSFTGDY